MLGRRLVFHVDQPRTSADRLQHQTAPEAELAAHLVSLPAEHRDPAHAAIAHPAHGRQRLAHQLHRHVRIGAVLGDPHEVVVELLFSVRVDLHRGLLLVGQVADQVAQLLEALEGEPEAAGREKAIAAAPGLGRLFEHEDSRTVLARRERRAHRRIAAADDDDVVGHDGSLLAGSAGAAHRIRRPALCQDEKLDSV